MKETLSRRINIRHKDKNVSLHFIEDYSVCTSGREPLTRVRLLSHGRCARQQRPLDNADRWMISGLLPQLTAGKWYEVIVSDTI
ncbi:hypothetical protein JHR70_000708 [Salmonella enterica]|nr:hypothetical protein [Salmonella enterica]